MTINEFSIENMKDELATAKNKICEDAKTIADWERKYNELSDYTNQIKADGIKEAIQNTPTSYDTGTALQKCEDLYEYARKLTNNKPNKIDHPILLQDEAE